MKSNIRRIILLALVAVFSMAASCGGPKTTKHKLAVYTADGYSALIATTDSVEVLQVAGKLTPAAAKNVYQINLRLGLAVDVIRNRAQTGFDKKEALTIIKQIIDDVRAAEAAGVINLEGKTRTQFLQVTFWLQFTATSIQAVIEATKEPELKEPEVAAASFTLGAKPKAQDETVWSDLVLIAQRALVQGLQHSRMTEVEAFAAGEELSRQLKESLNAKIAALP